MKAEETPEKTDRQRWMSVLAKAKPAAVAEVMGGIETPDFTWLRAPEIGAVMVRGRQGATGQPFNLGEMTVTRAVLRLSSGEEGHAMVQGRDKAHAEAAAMVDALMQTERAEAVRGSVLAPLEAAAIRAKAARKAKADGTKVDFFTMVRGED